MKKKNRTDQKAMPVVREKKKKPFATGNRGKRGPKLTTSGKTGTGFQDQRGGGKRGTKSFNTKEEQNKKKIKGEKKKSKKNEKVGQRRHTLVYQKRKIGKTTKQCHGKTGGEGGGKGEKGGS